jgi:lipopolysaccharide export system permease protein
VSVLTRYLNRVFAVRLVVVLFAITGFAVALDLLEVGDALARAPEGPGRAALRYVGLRLPMIVSELLPLAALLAGILAVGDLLRHRELVVVWGTGLSAMRVLRRLLPAVLILFAGKLTLDDAAVPRVAAELRAWGIGEFKQGSVQGDPGDWYWLRAGDDILRIAAEAAAAGRLSDVTVLRRDDRGLLTETLDAAFAEPAGGGLRLIDVSRRVLGTREVERLPELTWTGEIDLSLVRLLATPPRELGAGRLLEIMEAGAYGMRAPEPYSTALHARAAGAVLPGLLLLLAFALGRTFDRTATVAPILIKGVAVGFSAIILSGVAGAFGEIGVLPPALAAWSPILLLAALVLLLARPGHRLRPSFA